STVQVVKLPAGALIEMEATAEK
ncbi:MAG: hypothetical protein CO099_10020, partial [Bdellovibrio sp. CG_4_9_14_3_um_filter_39_7]